MADYSFGKPRRLLNAGDYKSVFDQADLKVSTAQLLLLARFNDQDGPRLGMVIAKKNVRLAVARNRIKRIVRDSFRLQQQQLDHIDIVVLARRGVDQISNPELQQMLNQLWRQQQKKARRKKNSGSSVKG